VHYLYILYSRKLRRYYVGETPDLEHRFLQHQDHYFKKNFTRSAEDWKIVLSKVVASKEKALLLERFIKRMKSKKFIEKVITQPEILDDILAKS
jgi:putative endonuclease